MNTVLNLSFYDQSIKHYVQTFQEYMFDYQRFSKNFELLMNGLSQEQREFLISAFSRNLYVYNGQQCSLADFTPDEIVEQQNVKEDYENNIRQENNHYRYKNFLLPEGNFYFWIFYYELGINLLKNQDKIQNKDIIDAGASNGDSCLILNKLNPRKIYAFEPFQEMQELLEQTIQLNELQDTVMPVKKGLGQVVGTQECAGNVIEVDTIDNYAEKNSLDVGLIKIHVEGEELNVLKGAEKTVRKFKPVIISAIYHNAEEFFELKPLLESWDLGYKFRFERYCPDSIVRGLHIICEAE